MNTYYNIYKENIDKGRGPVFEKVVETFSGPMDFLEIGTIRSLDPGAWAGDGWSTFWWCDYIKENGGKLVVVDINPSAVEACKVAAADFIGDINIEFHADDGAKFISSDYDFIYLDGSDCPDEMLQQFNKIDRTKTSILCDDFSQKGFHLLEKDTDTKEEIFSNKDFEKENLFQKDFKTHTILSVKNGSSVGHPMAFYPKVQK